MQQHSFGKVLQDVWDWRAAGNFMFGGTGSGLLFLVAAFSFPGNPNFMVGLLALFFVALGLTLVWLEIGRPWRFINVYFNPWTSWMSREAFVAAVVFGLAFIGILFEIPIVTLLGGLAGLFFLYCQARILKASKGVPAWREPAIMPFIQVTGLTEGAGLLAFAYAALGVNDQFLLGLFALLLILRMVAWVHYRRQLKVHEAPAAAQAVLAQINTLTMIIGNLLPLALIGATIAITAFEQQALCAVAGVLAVLGGWLVKFTIVTRAAHYQGYAFAKPIRGKAQRKQTV